MSMVQQSGRVMPRPVQVLLHSSAPAPAPAPVLAPALAPAPAPASAPVLVLLPVPVPASRVPCRCGYSTPCPATCGAMAATTPGFRQCAPCLHCRASTGRLRLSVAAWGKLCCSAPPSRHELGHPHEPCTRVTVWSVLHCVNRRRPPQGHHPFRQHARAALHLAQAAHRRAHRRGLHTRGCALQPFLCTGGCHPSSRP